MVSTRTPRLQTRPTARSPAVPPLQARTVSITGCSPPRSIPATLFEGADEMDQVGRIFSGLGLPSAARHPALTGLRAFAIVAPIYAGCPDPRLLSAACEFPPWFGADAKALVDGLLEYDQDARLTCADAADSQWFLADDEQQPDVFVLDEL